MDSAWEGIFMLLVLKIPVVYLGVVVWWAIRAEPPSDGGAAPDDDQRLLPLVPCGWDDWKRNRRSASRGRRPFHPRGPRHVRPAAARAEGSA